MKKQLLFLILSLLTISVQGSIRLPNVVSSNMVLQQQSTAKLWGWASPGEKIKITSSWDNKTVEISVDGSARWQVGIQTPKAGGPYTITLEGENKIVLDNVLIGEVWVASGQSNMEWSYNSGVDGMKEELRNLNKMNIRLFNMPKTTSTTPQDNGVGSWAVCDSNSLKSFSAVGYFFAKKLNEDLDVPIGVINSSWGGTPAEAWTPTDLVENNALLAQAATKNNPTNWWPVIPGYAYNGMIAPITNYTIAGAIWYQGESNTGAPLSYTELMNTMIGGWRKAWKKDFPFYYVQIAPFHYGNSNVGALVREAQAKTLSFENTGMVVISDLVSDTMDIHPTNKKDVGLRLANMALAETYGLEKGAYKSPLFKMLTIEGNQAIIDFDYAEVGLVQKGEKATEIYIAGEDRMFYPANVKIKGNKLLVSSKQVKTPVAVRYEFSNAGMGNLFSNSGLPVAPFRTDAWEVDTGKVN